MVSVVIPTYNRAHLLNRAIQSILNQTCHDFEIIVVDDSSIDNTAEIIRSIGDQRIRYIRHQVNEGVSEARNTGIKAARGKFIGFLDSDDEWLPGKLRKQLDKFGQAPSDTGLVYGSCLFVDEATTKPIRPVMARKKGHVFRDMLMSDFVLSPTPLVRKECFDKVGLFDRDFQTSEDWDMWLRIAQHYEFDFVRELVAKYYVSPSQTTGDSRKVTDGYRKFMAKHEALISGNPAILSHHLKVLAQIHLLYGEYDSAKGYFARALRANRHSLSLYIHLLASHIAPKAYVSAGKWLNAHIEQVRYRWPT